MCDRAVTGIKPAWHKSTDCEEERVVDRRKGREIKKGRGRMGNEVGLYWSDSTSRWGTTVWQWWCRWSTIASLQPELFSAVLQCLLSISILAEDYRTPFHICTHGSTARAHSQCNPTTALDTHHCSARSGSQGIKSPCSSAALMHTHTPTHACTLKCCHFSTYHLSSKSWTVKSIRVLQVIVLPDTHELSS